MKYLNVLFIILSIMAVNPASLAAEVKMKSLSYDPKLIEISSGESIVWKNTSYTEHSATSGGAPLEFDTGMVHPGKESRSIRFEKPGTYKYHCSLHGLTMSGVIVVKANRK